MSARQTDVTPTAHFAELFATDGFPYPRTQERLAALERLHRSGFPLRHDETWSHTPLQELVRQRYRLPSAANTARQPATALVYPGGWRAWEDLNPCLVVDGGSLAAAASRPAGVTSHATDPTTNFQQGTQTAFSQLNQMFAPPVDEVVVPMAGERPWRAHYANLISAGVLAAPRRGIVIPSGARATVVESYAARGEADSSNPSLCVPHTDILVGAGAQLELIRVQLEADSAYHVGSTNIVMAERSDVRVMTADLGGKLARHTLSVLLAGSHARCHLAGVTVAGGSQWADAQTYVEHAEPGSSSRQLFKRVLTGAAGAVFAGRIVVRDIAQQTDAFQLNNNLLLGSGRVVTLPQLEIAADDVRCSHGATVGQLDEDQMFYLRARGISPRMATAMLAIGFTEEALAQVADAEVRNNLGQLVRGRLTEQLEASQS